MKRIMYVVLAMLFAFLCASCGQKNQESPQEVQETVVKRTVTEEQSTASIDKTNVTNADSYQGDGVSAEITGISYEEVVTKINVHLKNDTDDTVQFGTANLSVNGLMCNDSFLKSVSAKSEIDAFVEISNRWFVDMGIEKIKECELVVKVYDKNNDQIMSSQVLKLTTDAPEEYEQQYDKSGVALYNQNGIILSVRTIQKSRFSDDTELVFYAENNTDSAISVMATDVLVNGVEVEPDFVLSVGASKKAIDTMVFSAKDLTDNGIETINKVSAKFKAFNDNLETVMDTEVLEIPIAE